MNPVKYLSETIDELRHVSWPSRQDTIKLTVIVIAISLIVALYVGGLDFTFTNLLTLIIK
ncbi:MAG: Preprotein translocase, SecE subunit [Candidatus Amesbacteria bacterium GW2011_GWA1_47_20]|uniref:Protein translocase subunit SecE n=1 Tax=Candidatus Amesbacteria bacterium GW2011_GWA1_47_20 TaxID=1618354 RepID=A0A0G1SK14_9BACT|nr:MAG: protein translocase subunit SecE/sec61 gamma, preprotein translocase subunit SecE [Microgenomates group bacterium GW2011_GWC1_46_20]KKU69777.1 MAG: Preprotein translocase, SecE subunit [Candidatus Amesbacteria bacterium GW2011_GWA1_47_20]